MKDLFLIQVIVNANVRNLVVLLNIQIIQTACVGKKLVDPLVEECTENIDETRLVNITVKNENSYYKCSSCSVYIMFIITSTLGQSVRLQYKGDN